MAFQTAVLPAESPMFAPRRGSLKDQISIHHVEGAQTARTTQQIYDRSLPSLHFLRWRPLFHLLAPNAWMNDPCGPCYDATTGLYHISFQWNPRRNRHGNVSWGKVAWGSATSKDLLSWNLRSAPTLKPDTPIDEQGIFTGCVVPTGIDGSAGKLTAVYTSVSGSHVHYTLPYKRGCETQSIAESTDGGKTWNKFDGNPILREPPADIEPCGWRDPFVAAWASIDKALGVEENTNLYGVVSGGLAGKTPTLFLYSIPRNHLDKWQFISPLVNLGLNHRLSRWSGEMGQNWESGNFMTLRDSEGNKKDFIIVAAEGCNSNGPSISNGVPQRSTQVARAARSQQWMSGEFVTTQGENGPQIEMKYRIGGQFDHGGMYGVNSFWDPVSSKQIAWGWIREEDLPQQLVDRQNWSGLMSLPRELSLLTLHNVTGTISSEDLQSITTLEVKPSTTPGLHTIHTLGISPAATLQDLRSSSRELTLAPNSIVPTLSSPPVGRNRNILDIQTCRFELLTSVSIPSNFASSNRTVNISIAHTPPETSPALHTTISFCPATSTVTLHRPNSSHVDPQIITTPEKAPHTLFKTRDPVTGKEEIEKYDVRIWFDESVIEIFVNGRTAISSRIYPGRKRCWGGSVWIGQSTLDDDDVEMNDDTEAEDHDDVVLIEAKAWDGMRADIKIV